MAQNRLQGLKRLLQVQLQRQQVQEWQLSSLEQRHRLLVAEMASLHAVAGSALIDRALMADLVARRLRRKGFELAAIEGEREKTAARLLAMKRRTKPIEKALSVEQADERRRSEAADLADLIERLANNGASNEHAG